MKKFTFYYQTGTFDVRSAEIHANNQGVAIAAFKKQFGSNGLKILNIQKERMKKNGN